MTIKILCVDFGKRKLAMTKSIATKPKLYREYNIHCQAVVVVVVVDDDDDNDDNNEDDSPGHDIQQCII